VLNASSLATNLLTFAYLKSKFDNQSRAEQRRKETTSQSNCTGVTKIIPVNMIQDKILHCHCSNKR